MRIPHKPTKSAGRDPWRPRRLRRCVNQDRSRGRNYTSNRGGHATFNGSVRLDTSGTTVCGDRMRCVLPMRPCEPHSRMCSTLGRFPEMATSIAGGASTSRRCNPKMLGASSFSKTCSYRVPSTMARLQQFSWLRNKPEPLPRGLRTAVATTTSRPPSSRTKVSAPEGARQIQQGPQPKELPRLPSPEGRLTVCDVGA
jgi:hypothetical protein